MQMWIFKRGKRRKMGSGTVKLMEEKWNDLMKEQRVLVFSGGLGGDFVADYIEKALPVDVMRVIDWRNAPYAGKDRQEICRLTEMALERYIGKIEVIVLASVVITMVAEKFLRAKYPQQKFVGYAGGLPQVLHKVRRAMILTAPAVKKLPEYKRLVAECTEVQIEEPECLGWAEEIQDDEISEERLKTAVDGFSGGVIVLFSADFLDVKQSLEEIVGWRAEIVDFRRLMLCDLCKALGLRGVDGRRPRERLI